ncbi:MAG: ArsR family transcriptional regulator [Promethearchaeota archaeon]|nr:MAG: ArsR family transcriptional regulator [Candidatus Lokiarchaeota archaeon]
MESWNISKKLKGELLTKASGIEDNSRRILFILRNLGPQRFTNLIKYSNLSRSTVSKYLNFHRKNNYVEQRIITDKLSNKQYQGYVITERGIEKLGEEPLRLKKELFMINELKNNVKKLENLIAFYKEISVEESFIFHIVRIISKIGDNFFEIQQDRDLYLALFYVFYNSILGQGAFAKKYWRLDELNDTKRPEEFSGYKLKLDQFCEIYKIAPEAINYLARLKLMTNELGFYLIKRKNDDFFFHEEDLLGTTTLRLIKDRLIEEIIYIDAGIHSEIYDLDKMSEEIAEHLKEMGLIWNAIQEQFELLILNLIIKNAIDMGFLETDRKKLMEIISQSKKLPKSIEGRKLQESILEGSRIEENLNILTIIENES